MLVELALQSSTDCIGCWENLSHFKESCGAIGETGKIERVDLRVILEVILITYAMHKSD